MTELLKNASSTESPLCRLCGQVNLNGTYIFSEEVEHNLSFLINKYLPLKVENDGKYPDKICPGCEIQLEATKLFFDLIIEGQNELKTVLEGLKNTQFIQLQDLNRRSKTGTLEVRSVETGEKYFIQILQNAGTDNPLYGADHDMFANMNILMNVKRKRGRPRKQPVDKNVVEDVIEDVIEEVVEEPNNKIEEEVVDDGKRHRKIPARFSETVQGKELDDILRKEGIEEDDLDSEISSKLEMEVIGRMEIENGEKTEGALVMSRKIDGFKKSVITRRKRRRKFKCKCNKEFITESRLKIHIGNMHKEDITEVLEEGEILSSEIKIDSTLNVPNDKTHKDTTEEIEESETGEIPRSESSQSEKNENPESSSPNTSSRTELEEINEEGVNDDSDKSFSCDTCSEIFKSEIDLAEHMENKHQIAKQFKCPECNRSFSYRKTFELHLQRHKGLLSCEVCEKKFNHASSLIYHRNAEHNNGKRFVCNKCNKTFKHRQLLHRHQLVHTEERPFKCTLCSSAFKTKTNLISHNATHTGEKNFVCSRCGQSFAHKTSLNLHMRWHLGEKPFFCEVCQKRFSQKGNLLEHLRIHTGEKPFCCEVCGTSFTTSSQLKLHSRRHTGERPWKCEYCVKTFIHKDSWKEHCRRHLNDRPFKCELCSKSFIAMHSLKKHMRFHTGEKPHSCEICLKGFSDHSNLTKHRRIHQQKPKEDQTQDLPLLDSEANNLLYVYYESPKDPSIQNIEVPLMDLEQAQSDVVMGDQDVLDFKGDCMHIQQLIDQEGNPLSLNTQDGQQINVVTSITNGEEKLQGLLPDGTLVALDLQDSKVANMERLVDQVEEEASVSHLLLDGNMTFLNDNIDKTEDGLLVTEQPNLCFVTYDPTTGTM